ncbi:MAG: outer membrane lipoprotein-sorting protein [Gammaproteobacteria bacterium]|jgi:outer membrane lipoprotein-sorting protein
MSRFLLIILSVVLVSACSKEQGGVTGSEPKEMLTDVQKQLDQAAATAEKRLEDGMKKIDGDH